jgi:outer membrane protein OmpA-like peptidoglycan-associated protein/opacity protein-like surface antigen
MRFAARCIGTIAVALVMVAAIRADDTTKPKAVKEERNSVAAPIVVANSQPVADTSLPLNSSTTDPLAPTAPATDQTTGGMHRWNDGEAYTPKIEWFLGYSFWRAVPTSSSNRMGYLHGGSTSVAYNVNRYLGLVADFAGFDNSRVTLFTPTQSETFDSNGSAYTYLFGPRLSYRKYERFTPFAQALFGGTHASSVKISGCTGDPSCTPLGSDNAFASMFGAGLDIKLTHRIALRLIEGDFLLTHFHDPFSTNSDGRGWQKNVRLSSGIVFRFGGNLPPPPSLPMSASCSADKEFVYAGSDEIVAVRADASNTENRPLNYSWSANQGAIDGTGPAVRWNSSHREPGVYTIHVRMDNGRTGSASCSVNVRVERRPNRLPTIMCSADRTSVTAGDSVEISATASDPDNDPLTFSWSASGGRIEGTGSSARFYTTDLRSGAYTITGHVDDGRTGMANCSVRVDVQLIQVAEVKELETRLALHSIYFPTARPTVANPAGGLVESQQKVLLSLAEDFNRYLTFKPQAHLILEGHADRRGSVEYNKQLTERRVERTKNFLVEQGVPSGNIETRSLGKEENMDAGQVKELVDKNPDLTDEERRRIEANLQIIVLANNRRVDVSLTTTGQQSIRQYPFNAKDSLTLLSADGGDEHTPAKLRARKKTANP